MKRLLAGAAIIVGTWACGAPQSADYSSLQQLYEGHRWFELRDAIAGKPVPALYSGAVASAFNRMAEAEKYLNEAVRQASRSEAANEAREQLVELYMRISRLSDAIRVLDAGLAAAPSRSDFRNVRTFFEAFRNVPSQTVRTDGNREFLCTVRDDGIYLPAVVNGTRVEWLLDTAFSMTALNESEARMLGISISNASAEAGDFAAGTTTTRAAVAERVIIGDTELRNVPVGVFPDSQPPWNEQLPGHRGTIGLPAVLALQGVRWTRDGKCQLGPQVTDVNAADQNLSFDGGTPVTRVSFGGRKLDFIFDTGAQGGTQLWERFAKEFPNTVSAGQVTTKQVNQIGGSREEQIIAVSELRLGVGGFDAVLRPAEIFSRPIGNEFQHGKLGLDVFRQASQVTIDFRTMSAAIR